MARNEHASSPNLILRFVLEIVALIAIGYWAWGLVDGVVQYLAAVGLPVIAAAVWGIFAVPGDPSRSGNAPIPVSGIVRLVVEWVVLGLGAVALFASVGAVAGAVFAGLTVFQYAFSVDRIRWLLAQTA